jgi:hypothetical protein
MTKHGHIFLSYSSKDLEIASALEHALLSRKVRVWRDQRSITAGAKWADAIEKGVRFARGVIVLATTSSAKSDWVIYEYALATGAGIPIAALVYDDVKIPKPLRRFQVMSYLSASKAADGIIDWMKDRSRTAGRQRASFPKLMARFQEFNGELHYAKDGESICMDLWIDDAPHETSRVEFEIMDLGFRDRKWTKQRPKRNGRARKFLTEDMNSYGDVEIWARGTGRGPGSWLLKSTLYEALVRGHGDRPANIEFRRGLRQIRGN